MEKSVADLLERAHATLGELAALPIGGLSDESLTALVSRVEAAGRLVDAVRALAAGEVADRSRFGLGSDSIAARNGQKNGLQLLTALTRASEAEAARRIRLGEAIRPRTMLDGQILPAHCPTLAAAFISGTVGVDAASTIVRCLDQASRRNHVPEQLDAAELELTAAATLDTADNVATMARVWREYLDPDGAELRDSELRDQRNFRFGRERNGMTPFSGVADPTSAALLRAAFTEANAPDAAPRFLSEEDAAQLDDSVHAFATDTPFPRDPRTREQRQLDVLIGLITAGLRSTNLKCTATVMAVVQLSDLRSGTGVGWLDDVEEPVSAATIQELACDAGFRRMLLGTNGEVLALGRTERLFSTAQRLALAVRDGGCVWSGCSAPPSWCHAHHVREWTAHDGPTDIDNGTLLCPAHHHQLHNSGYQMRMVDGRPQLLAPVLIDPDQRWRPVGRSRVTMGRALQRAS
ncbi:MAG: DUF222 domain-containing protein [Rhodoglobus sp.]